MARRRREAKPAEAPCPRGAFVAELAEWAGEKFKASNQEQVDPIVTGSEGADVHRHQGRAEGPPGEGRGAVHDQHAPAAGQLRLRFTAKHTMMIAQRLYEGVTLGGEGRSRSSLTCVPTARASPTDALKACRDHIKTTYGEQVSAGEAERLRRRQGCPGRPRSDPADRCGLHAGTGCQAILPPEQLQALHADLQPLRRLPDDAGDFRGHQRRDSGGQRRVQGPGQDR